jgi:hypothetical protein
VTIKPEITVKYISITFISFKFVILKTAPLDNNMDVNEFRVHPMHNSGTLKGPNSILACVLR